MVTENKCPHCGKPVPATALQGICPECMLKAGLAETGEVGPGGMALPKSPPPASPHIEEIASHFPQLEIVECLGCGGMGAVYKARQPKLDRFVALKILTRSRDSGISDTEFAARFQQEARALARLNHPDIVDVYDYGEAGGYHYLLMEFVDGLTLRQLLQTQKLSPEQALAIVPKICDALQFAHERGIVHRDIKPENILLDKQGCVKIADFGIAKILGSEMSSANLTGAKDRLGTPHYMAPEQVETPQKVDHRADIYSLGVVFYEMLTGELPLGKFQSPSKKVHVDVRLDEVVLHALEKEPERRYQHASEVKTDVEAINTSAPASTPSPASPATEVNPWQLAILLVGALVGSALLLIGIVLRPPANWLAILFGAFVLVVSLLKLAGRWPFPSGLFRGSTFTGRNVPGPLHSAKSAPSPWWRAVRTGLAVFALVFGLLAVITILLPRTYEARARIQVQDPKLDAAKSDSELDWLLRDVTLSFPSAPLLERVATDLELRKRWSARNRTLGLKEEDTRAMLANQLILQRIPRSATFEIRCFSTKPAEAAEIANKVAEVLCASPAGAKASLIERATPPRQHVRPNEPLNLAFAATVGLVLGIAVAAGVLLVTSIRPPGSKQAAKPPVDPIATQPATSQEAGKSKSVRDSGWVLVARWTAHVLGTLLLAFYAFFVLAEGLPPITAQPEGVQLNFVALGLMLAGFVAGWKREGTAALLIACGWTLWQISEGRIKWNLFQTPLPVAMLYGFCWWATRGRRTGVVMGSVVVLATALLLGQLFLPTSVLVRGAVLDAQTGQPVPDVEVRLLPRTAQTLEKGDPPNARANQKGRFTLYVGWYEAARQVGLSAPGYTTLTTNLGPRAFGERNLSRDFRLQPLAAASVEPEVPPVVIATLPESGAAGIEPTLTELRVTFSKPMRDGSWSWTKWGEDNFPELDGQPQFLGDQRTCVLPVRLRPGQVYAIWLNSDYHQDFRDSEGKSAVPYLLIFETRK